jgi:hypothetical protein
METLEVRRVGANLPHCSEVKLEVAHGFSTRADVGLIDQLRAMTVSRRQPRDLDACEVALQALDQRHEVPYREDVRLHEKSKRLDVPDRCKQRMFDHALPHRVDIARVVRHHVAHSVFSSMYRSGRRLTPPIRRQHSV